MAALCCPINIMCEMVSSIAIYVVSFHLMMTADVSRGQWLVGDQDEDVTSK